MADYLRDLRALVGHRPLVLPGTAVLFTDGEGRLLLEERADNRCWGVPGGMMEPGESVEDTARREFREETGLEVARLTLYGVFSGPGYFYRYPNGDEVWNVTVAFTATEAQGALRADAAESLRLAFFPLHALPGPLSPPVCEIISRFSAERARP